MSDGFTVQEKRSMTPAASSIHERGAPNETPPSKVVDRTRSGESKRPSLPPATYSLNEFASLLGISYTKAQELLHAGGLPVKPIQIGRTYHFPKAIVDRMLGIDSDAVGAA